MAENAVATKDEDAIEGVVVAPELVFTTPKRDEKVEDVAARTIPFDLDGEIYHVVRPHKLEETMAALAEAEARRATIADRLYAGSAFLRKVLTPSSASRLQARLDDDTDPFRLEDLYDILGRIVDVLAKDNQETRPARARARARR